MNKQKSDLLRRFSRNDAGGVALIFGLALVPLLGFAGVGMDYARSSQLRTKMAVAADAAVLNAIKAGNVNPAERKRIADATFAANVGTDPSLFGLTGRLVQMPGNGWRYEATANYKYSVLQAVPGFGTQAELAVFAEAAAGDNTVEVSLVLDTTGSMANDMTALRRAATDFTNTLFETVGNNSTLKMAVVPYVAAVNPGRMNLGMGHVDTRGESIIQARNMRGRVIGWVPNCDSAGGVVQPPGPPGPQTPPGPGRGRPGRGVWLDDALKRFADVGHALLGIRPAHAQVGTYGTPNRTAPWSGTTKTVSPPWTQSPTQVLVPQGFLHDNPCFLQNPNRIAYLDLFDGIRSRSGSRAQWKGCVEARLPPFDVTDTPPDPRDPNTLFTPYFWPDEPGTAAQGAASGNLNNFMDDSTTVPTGWATGNEDTFWLSILKYDGTNRNATITETGPVTSGPNRACPDELLRLTNNRNRITGMIASLSEWQGGGTISSEGLMWGWRTLSPNAPFADGVAYGTKGTSKFLVLMTDGENEIGGNNLGGAVFSHYSAYNYLNAGNFPTENFQDATKHLDQRLALACKNAKDKGIQVITILFRVNTPEAQKLLRECASDGKFFYQASNQSDLQRAFADVAATIGRVRLTR